MLSQTHTLEEILSPLATEDNNGNEMTEAVISQVGEWLKTERFPHVHIWPLSDLGRSLYITLGNTPEAAKSSQPDGKSVTLHFRVIYESLADMSPDRDENGNYIRRMVGLNGYRPMQLVNYASAKNGSASYVRPGAYVSSPIPPNQTPEELIAWITGADQAPAKTRQPRTRKAQSAPALTDAPKPASPSPF